MSKLGVYALDIIKIDPQSHAIDTARVQHEFLGSFQEVNEWRKKYLANLSADNPEAEYKAECILLEEIGPRTLIHLRSALSQRDTNALMAQVLAGQVASLSARDALEINPDLTRESQKVLQDAATTVQQIQSAQAGVPEDMRRIAQA